MNGMRRLGVMTALLLATACGSDDDPTNNPGNTGGTSSEHDGGGTGSSVTGTGGAGSVDPNGPKVSLSDVACGAAVEPNAVIGGRDVMIDYPCDKPEGTPVTFILNLHGTMGVEEAKFYQHVYFAAYAHVDSHDFVVATPRAIGSQWGREDGGQDEPHLYDVIDWVYERFAAFDIRAMWVVGHSWGSAYTLGFACMEDLADKVKGVVLMSGGPAMPACADRLSVMATVGETDIVMGQPDQSATAAAHGCGEMTTRNLGNNVITEWPDCDPGWVHKNYLMLGKGHGFVPTDWPDETMASDMMDSVRSIIE